MLPKNLKSDYLPMMSANVLVTTNVHAQLKAVATEAADPRIFPGKISPIISLIKRKNLTLVFLS
jgi:hypothetical protein